jgi:hypothetical protein
LNEKLAIFLVFLLSLVLWAMIWRLLPAIRSALKLIF